MSSQRILRIFAAYLLGVPIVTSINGLCMYLLGVSVVGPLYHTLLSSFLIGIGLTSRSVRKSWTAISLAFSSFALFIIVQALLGFSDFAPFDLGVQYKWYMPILLLSVYCRWDYVGTLDAQLRLSRTFRTVPLIYVGLILLSFCTAKLFSFNPTPFMPGTAERFAGFAWAYNPTVNVFLICAYINLLLLQTASWKKLAYGLAFLLLLSKSAVAYFSVLGFSLIRPYLRRRRGSLCGSRSRCATGCARQLVRNQSVVAICCHVPTRIEPEFDHSRPLA